MQPQFASGRTKWPAVVWIAAVGLVIATTYGTIQLSNGSRSMLLHSLSLEQVVADSIKNNTKTFSSDVSNIHQRLQSIEQRIDETSEMLKRQQKKRSKQEQPAPAAPAPQGFTTNRRIVVSLSTFIERTAYVPPTVYSLVHQKLKPSRIYLWVPTHVKRFNETTKEIPQPAKMLQEQFSELVQVRETEDYGPATKLLPTLKVENDPDTIIITVDDDVYYHPDTIEDLVKAIIKDPEHFHVRSCEETIEENGNNITKWMLNEGICKGFITAYASAAYLRKMWPDDGKVFDFSTAPEGCRYHDDVWLSGHLYRRGIRPHVVNAPSWSVLYHMPYTKYAVNKIDNTIKHRDDCLHHFGWLLDRTLQYQKQ